MRVSERERERERETESKRERETGVAARLGRVSSTLTRAASSALPQSAQSSLNLSPGQP